MFFCNFSSCSRQIIEPIIREIMTKYLFSLKLEKRKKTNISIVIYFLRCFFRQSEQGRIFVKIKFFRFYFFSTKNGDRFFVFFFKKYQQKSIIPRWSLICKKTQKMVSRPPRVEPPKTALATSISIIFFLIFYVLKIRQTRIKTPELIILQNWQGRGSKFFTSNHHFWA